MKSNLIIQKQKRQVIKICKSPKMFKKELYIYQKNLPFTPRLIDHDGKNTLMLEYIDGIPIGELAQSDFSKIAELFLQLHNLENKKGKVICHYDNNPKNYLFKNGKYFMIDFGEWKYDRPEIDLIHFLLFWASIYNKRKFDIAFKKLMQSYLKSGDINPLEWEMLIPEVIEHFDSRRERYGKIEINADVNENRERLKNIYQ
ncbi:MAG: phosphotransferase [Candidatus Cloacimonetes bacterium]|nr:phosphotransferase [Candidatus Cloacimonadota bacterium]MCF7814488.1 phosphotransferase [Candidatus Cloacimonadota bacterium]MCF7867880.1 phosphotransferase [Candidatus Cloacimonadota bacterium]MCF7883699.1 phosphotransferase [Candidatus Cloacimonadota bacterium]